MTEYINRTKEVRRQQLWKKSHHYLQYLPMCDQRKVFIRRGRAQKFSLQSVENKIR